MKKFISLITLTLVTTGFSVAHDLSTAELVSSLNMSGLMKIATCELKSNSEQKLSFYAAKGISELNDGDSVDLIAIADLYRKVPSTNMNISLNVYATQFRDHAAITQFIFLDRDDFSGTLNWAPGAKSQIVASPRNHRLAYTCKSSTEIISLED